MQFIDLKHKNIVVDFCVSFYDSSGKIIYPKLKSLEMLGEKANYFGYFSFKCPSSHRYKNKYVSTSTFLREFEVYKINFYSTTQDLFNNLTTTKFYPRMSKNLMRDIFDNNNKYVNYERELKKLRSIITNFDNSINNEEIFSYRFEFRLNIKETDLLQTKLHYYLNKESFIYLEKNSFLVITRDNLKTIYEYILKTTKALMNIGKFVLLEILFSLVYLKVYPFPLIL